jgi:hypothetical protein
LKASTAQAASRLPQLAGSSANRFLKECFFPFVVHFTKFAENIIAGAVPYVRTQRLLMCEQLAAGLGRQVCAHSPLRHTRFSP